MEKPIIQNGRPTDLRAAEETRLVLEPEMRSKRRFLRLPLVVLVAVAIGVGACGDGETDTDPTPPLDDEEGSGTVPRDDSGAVGEPDDEDSQTDVGRLEEDVVPTSGTALVIGAFGDDDIELELTEDTQCAIREAPEAGDQAAAEVEGATTGGESFSLDWSVDVGNLTSTVELDGTTWTTAADLDERDERVIRLTRNGEVFLDVTYEAGTGEERQAQLFVNCRPDG